MLNRYIGYACLSHTAASPRVNTVWYGACRPTVGFNVPLDRVKYEVNAAICIAHRHEHVFNALPLPVSRR